jgi:hypothetical protein
MDRANRRLFIGCRSKVMAVMNADTGRVITTLPIGTLKAILHRLDLTSGTAVWTEPDSVTISAPAAKAAAQGK